MNLFSLFATIGLDTSDYEKGVKSAQKSVESMKDDITELAHSYESKSADIADAMEDASDDIEKSQKSISSTAKTESEKTKSHWTTSALDVSKAWNVLKTGAKAAVAGITAVGGALVATSALTEEYRVAQGKLNTAFEAAGYSSETAKQAYSDFYAILGDVDTATEASQLLAKLAQSEEDMATWTRTAAGVWGTFGDSLPIEGLIESANETAKTGTVVGVLADALNWAGISEDDFNAKLAAAGNEAERNQLIMNTLSDTYDGAADAFYRNNEQIIKNREQQASLTASMAKIGAAVDKVKSAFMERFTPAIGEASDKIADWISKIDIDSVVDLAVDAIESLIDKAIEVKDIFVEWFPVIASVSAAIATFVTVMTTVSTVQKAVTAAQAALNAVMNANPFILVATIIASLVVALITLWNTNEDFRNAVTNIWEGIKQVFSGAWEFIKSVWDKFSPYFKAIWEPLSQVVGAFVDAVISFVMLMYESAKRYMDNIASAFKSAWEAIKTVWDVVSPYFSAIWENIQSIFSVVADVLSSFFSTAWLLIKAVWDTVTSYFETIFNTIAGIFSAITSVLRGDFESAWEAVKGVFEDWGEFFSGLLENLREIFEGVIEFFTEVGGDIIEGIKQGISDAWDGLVSWFEGLWDSLFGDRSVDVDVDVNESSSSRPQGGGVASLPRSVNGSYAAGLDYVPFDGFIAKLHEGERILTAEEAKKYNPGGITVVQNIYSQAKNAAELMQEARNQQRKAVLLGNV